MVLTLEYREWTVRTLLMAHLSLGLEVTIDSMIDLMEEFIDQYVTDLDDARISSGEFRNLTQAVLLYCHHLTSGPRRILPSAN